MVLVFETPPDMAYFGFTPYVFSRYYPEQGRRMEPYASLGDTLNNLTVRHQLPLQSPYDKLTALVMTASLETYYKVATTLLVSGLLPMRTNPLIIPNNKVRLGNERDADTFQLLIRVAKPGIPAELDQYLETPPIYAYRVSTSNPSFTPITPPPIRPAGTGQDEKALTSTFHALSQAIALAHSDSLITPLKNNLSLPDPDFCLDTGKACHGDNRDSLYENVAFAPLTQHDNDYVIVYGVNHTLTQKTSYTNISVYDVNRLAGVVSRVEEDFAGSAAQYLDPVAYPYVDKLFVYKVARHCAPGELYCVSIPFDGNLSIPESAPISVVQRSYMEPATATAPLAAETIRLQGYRVSPSH